MARRKRIIGASRLKRKLKRLPEDVSEPLRRVIREEAEATLKDIQAGTPASGDSPPIDFAGRPRPRLKDAFEVRIAKDGLSSRVGIMGKEMRKIFFFVWFLEFGTKRIAARHFISNAWNRRMQYTRRRVKKEVVRALRRAAGEKVSDV